MPYLKNWTSRLDPHQARPNWNCTTKATKTGKRTALIYIVKRLLERPVPDRVNQVAAKYCWLGVEALR
jgi:hypothetical protein